MALEAAGLALGAIALVGPTISAFKTCSAIFMRRRKQIRELRRYADVISTEEHIFVNECILIISSFPGLDNDVAKAMVDDGDHPVWSDVDFQKHWLKYCQPYEAPILASKTTLETMGRKLDAVCARMDGDPDIAKASRLVAMYKWKAMWQLNGKEEMEELVKSIQSENARLTRLREQHHLLSALPRPRFKKLAIGTTSGDHLLRASKINEISKALYDDMANTVRCPCHVVYLQLQDIFDIAREVGNPTASGSTCAIKPTSHTLGSAKFRMIISRIGEQVEVPELDMGTCDCTSILVTSEFRSLEEVRETKVKQSGKAQAGVNKNSKKLRFMLPSRTVDGKENDLELGDSDPSSPMSFIEDCIRTIATPNTAKVAAASTQVTFAQASGFDIEKIGLQHTPAKSPQPGVGSESTTINDICRLMAEMDTAGPVTSNICLGYINNPGRLPACSQGYRHSVYRDIPAEPLRAARTSLATLLSPTPGRISIYDGDRYRMAHLLALSLFCLGGRPNTWFVDGWGSKDVLFFLRDGIQQGNNNPLETLRPFVMPCFSMDGDGQTMPASSSRKNTLARDPQLFSLAVVLVELAFGSPLDKITIPGRPACGSLEKDDELYSHAKSIFDTGLLVRQAGLKFSEVVERCFYGDFGVKPGETGFGNERMREKFYSTVIVLLKQRLEIFQ
ncbi:hypothetical protein BJ508DRAFT_419100 [Ascobolus immersus RN42]|uniref:DUF7580 domain-containing protein n=1 Tax=Ascobolus immersus RN42 TaxID=1160509 RepID=A0A3N4HGY4_ASCIM|nr:hypothetical protein BJ508DRAFT_419100 [Ascobolus immersus RN42]